MTYLIQKTGKDEKPRVQTNFVLGGAVVSLQSVACGANTFPLLFRKVTDIPNFDHIVTHPES